MSILEILEAHDDYGFDPVGDSMRQVCMCGTDCGQATRNPDGVHRAHVAQVLEQHEREREAAAKAEHRREWADHISEWHATVGAPICHVDAVVQALRSDHVPFGKGTTNGRD